MTEADKIGLLANLNRCLAQDTIHRGDFDRTNYRAVYDLFLTAHGSTALAERARSRAAERFVDEATSHVQQKTR